MTYTRRGGFRKSGKFRKIAIRQAAKLGGKIKVGLYSNALHPSALGVPHDEFVTWGLIGWVTCALCGKPVDLEKATIDHIIPKALGGKDGLFNLQLAHPSCNNEKGVGDGRDRTGSGGPASTLAGGTSGEEGGVR